MLLAVPIFIYTIIMLVVRLIKEAPQPKKAE